MAHVTATVPKMRFVGSKVQSAVIVSLHYLPLMSSRATCD